MFLTSYSFILFVLICFGLYYIIPKKCQWFLLLVASYIFYFINGVFYPLFLVATSIITYVSAIFIEERSQKDEKWLKENKESLSREERKEFKEKTKKAKKRIMLSGLLICLLMLGIFKYTNFMIDNINSVLKLTGSKKSFDSLDILLPMGLSFYTFQSLGYLIDIYWNRVKAQRNLFKYMLFVSFFPQLIQGPISRYSQVETDLYCEHSFDWQKIRFGFERILWGFFKKLVIADTIATGVTYISSDTEYYTGAWVLVGIIFYAIQLYADFSGGIDITIGVAEIFGITLPENFIRPFFSKNIAEFWRRWHITMGTWFRDYIFYPMSIAPSMNKLTKKCKDIFGKGFAKRVSVYISTMVTWFATGVWHGASWNFIIWGVLNGVVILASQECEPLYNKFHNKFSKFNNNWAYDFFQIVRTFFLMGCLRMLDCYRDAAATFKMFISMFTDFKISALSAEAFLEMDITGFQYLSIGIGCVIILIVSLLSIRGSVREQISHLPYYCKYAIFMCLLVIVILFGTYGYGFDANQFIYNQF